MALASSKRPASTSNKDNSLLDDNVFNQFVDAETFDFSDSSFGTRTPSDNLESWFDEPESIDPADFSASPPSSSSFVDSYNKTFILEEECATFPIDPSLDVPADSDVLPRTPARSAEEVVKLPSTVETVRRSQSCDAKKAGGRRRASVESPTMSHPRSRRGEKGGAWAQQLERSVQPQGIQSPPQSTRYGPISPPPTITQSRYQAHSQSGTNSQHRPMSYSSQISPLSQQFPAPTMPYFTTTSPVFPELSSYAQPYQPLDSYLTVPTGLNAPSFSNPFPSDADIAWDHEVAIAGADPTVSFMNTTAAATTGFNHTKVQPWAPPVYAGQPVPMTAPLTSNQHQYYTSSAPLTIQTTTTAPSYHLPVMPQTANPYTTRSISPMYAQSAYPTAPPLLAVPKTRRDRSSKSRSATPLSSSSHSRSPSPLSPLSTSASTSRSHGRKTRSATTNTTTTTSRRSRSRSQARHTSRHNRTTSSSIAKSSSHSHDHSHSHSRSHTHSSSSHHRHRSKSHAHHHSSTTSPTSPKRPTRHRKHKDGSAHDPFVNFTAVDSKKIMNGVAPSGSSKTKAKREKEAAERAAMARRELGEVAVRAVREAGGDLALEVFEREGRGLLMER